MFQALKFRSLAGALKSKGNAQEAYSAVVELGQLGSDKAVDLLISCLARRDGVSRAAARELGRIGNPRALESLTTMLKHPDINQSAAEALVRIGSNAVEPLAAVLKSEHVAARQLAASTLGDIADRRAVEGLIEAMQTDEDYRVRTAAANALGQIKDTRALWVLIGTLKLRDETTPERQAALEELRQATTRALHKIGDPLAKAAAEGQDVDDALRKMEQALSDAEVHPRLVKDVHLLSERELVEVLHELVKASEEVSWAGLERREPMLAGWFKTYERRAQVAQTVGQELHRRGGTALMRKVLEEQLASYPSISNWWQGVDGWQ
jgi:HEAT repeat protein